MTRPWFISTLVLAASLTAQAARAAETQYLATDSLRRDVAGELLERAGYEPGPFALRVADREAQEDAESPSLVRFTSPRAQPGEGDAANTVVLEWFPAESIEAGTAAPAVLVLHTLDPRLFIARGMARALAQRGIHAFVMHAPGYGLRRAALRRTYGDGFFERSMQSVADARRARDAIAALPGVDPQRISIQGTSLGGFWATAAASLDGGFDHAFIYLAGADLHGVLTQGLREAAWLRQSLERSGIDDQKLRELCAPLDPAHSGRRLDPSRTWLFSARADQVIPAASAEALARAVGLEGDHHIWLAGDHYTAMLHLPWVAGRIAQVVLREGSAAERAPVAADR